VSNAKLPEAPFHAWRSVCQYSTGFSVVELEVLVREDRAAIDGFGPRSVAVCEIASLDHEARDDPVECGSLVAQRLAGLGHSFLPCIYIITGNGFVQCHP